MLKSYSLIDNKFQHVITLMFYYSHLPCGTVVVKYFDTQNTEPEFKI